MAHDGILAALLISLVVSITIAVIALVLFVRLRMRLNRLDAMENNLENTLNDIRALTAGAVGLGKKLFSLEQDARRVQERQEKLEIQKDTSGRPYDQAIRMVHNGAGIDELMSICDFSRNEAELIVMMHRMDRAG